ncbi:MAG: Na/Pi cotransporter family protein [Sedimentisphaerales bacterium]|nr:Na/Pi cotransporter family protein [Sedimentisphaerales bacterium]
MTEILLGTIGGLGLFLFGMELMSGGLKKVAGRKMKDILRALTKKPLVGVVVGMLVTILMQSSSATTVMTVGFVNAGLLTLRQSLSVILGANIGTTFTAWLISGLAAFKITTYAMPAIGIGFLMKILCRRQKGISIGEVILGFGILFTGINFMKGAVAPLQGSEQVQQALLWLGQNPIVSVLVGAVLTMLLQCSAATIAVVQILAFEGAFGSDWSTVLRVAIPYVLGDNIGTTITAQLAAINTSLAARRTAQAHSLFNVIGVIYMLPLVWTGWYSRAVEWLVPLELSKNTIMLHIAISHSLFNIVNTIIFLPMLNVLEALAIRTVPPRAQDIVTKPIILERHLLSTPELALEQTRQEIVRMTRVAKDSINFAIEGLSEDNIKKLMLAHKAEDTCDEFQYEITSYLTALSRKTLSDEVSVALPVLLHTVNDLERIGDHAVNIAQIAQRKIDQKLSFSSYAKAEVDLLKTEINTMFDLILHSLEKNDITAAKMSLLCENKLNRMQVEFRRNHVQRMTSGLAKPEVGLIFIDIVDNVEKVGDHLTNIAQSVIGGLQWDGVDGNSLTGEYPVIEA